MKAISVLIIQLLCFILTSYSQTKTITGRIIDNFTFKPVGGANIGCSDTAFFTTTDFQKGEFKIHLPASIKSLLIRTVGYEEKSIFLNNTCNQLEIILEQRSTYCFMSPEESDMKRLKNFKKLPKLHKKAYNKGIFKTEQPCYRQKFIASTKWRRFQKTI